MEHGRKLDEESKKKQGRRGGNLAIAPRSSLVFSPRFPRVRFNSLLTILELLDRQSVLKLNEYKSLLNIVPSFVEVYKLRT